MDNSMIAIVSLIMIAMGFVNGMVFVTLLNKFETVKLHLLVDKLSSQRNSLQKTVDRLEDDLQDEEEKNEQLLTKLNGLVQEFSRLPPPQGPLERNTACSDTDSENSDFECPTSPDLNPDNKE